MTLEELIIGALEIQGEGATIESLGEAVTVTVYLNGTRTMRSVQGLWEAPPPVRLPPAPALPALSYTQEPRPRPRSRK